MRSGKLTAACAAALTSLMLVPAGALAHKHPSPNGRCRISINVAPRYITAGDPVVIFGRLVCHPGAAEAGQVVRLYHHLTRVPGSTYVQSTTTDAHGFYEFARADGVVETNRSWYVRSHGARSARKAIKVAAQVTLVGPPEGTQILTGVANKVTFTGTVNPADVGARVILQRQNAETGSEWRRIDSGQVEAGGNFTIVHTFIVPGDANIRVLVRSQGRNVPSASEVLGYEISQAQNPALTIAASADPIAFEQSVTISGTLAGGANEPVTLLAHTAKQQGFSPIAQVTTDASGNYTFPAQSPVNSTYYQVSASKSKPPCTPPSGAQACIVTPVAPMQIRSAVLYEGVKDVLSAQVSATTVQAGQQLTFSGSVAPNHAGHIIYLERQNASGHGFHVVEVASVNPGSIYQITHTVYDTGTKVFRVYIPGGPENEGAASPPFTIQVTPAPLASLTPEASSNTSQPEEGQS
jgi:hypothetical protein